MEETTVKMDALTARDQKDGQLASAKRLDREPSHYRLLWRAVLDAEFPYAAGAMRVPTPAGSLCFQEGTGTRVEFLRVPSVIAAALGSISGVVRICAEAFNGCEDFGYLVFTDEALVLEAAREVMRLLNAEAGRPPDDFGYFVFEVEALRCFASLDTPLYRLEATRFFYEAVGSIASECDKGEELLATTGEGFVC